LVNLPDVEKGRKCLPRGLFGQPVLLSERILRPGQCCVQVALDSPLLPAVRSVPEGLLRPLRDLVTAVLNWGLPMIEKRRPVLHTFQGFVRVHALSLSSGWPARQISPASSYLLAAAPFDDANPSTEWGFASET